MSVLRLMTYSKDLPTGVTVQTHSVSLSGVMIYTINAIMKFSKSLV